MKHYVAMSGDHGCLPDYCAAYETRESAIDSLVQLFELGKRRAHMLKVDGYLELNIRRDAADYCQVEECDCNNIHDHSSDF